MRFCGGRRTRPHLLPCAEPLERLIDRLPILDNVQPRMRREIEEGPTGVLLFDRVLAAPTGVPEH